MYVCVYTSLTSKRWSMFKDCFLAYSLIFSSEINFSLFVLILSYGPTIPIIA